MASSDYVHGKMNVAEQQSTFTGFINFSVWSGLLTAMGIFAALLVFGAHYSWLGAMIAAVVLGAVLGALVGLKGKWYITLAGITVVSVVIALIQALIGLFA